MVKFNKTLTITTYYYVNMVKLNVAETIVLKICDIQINNVLSFIYI